MGMFGTGFMQNMILQETIQGGQPAAREQDQTRGSCEAMKSTALM